MLCALISGLDTVALESENEHMAARRVVNGLRIYVPTSAIGGEHMDDEAVVDVMLMLQTQLLRVAVERGLDNVDGVDIRGAVRALADKEHVAQQRPETAAALRLALDAVSAEASC